MINKYMNYEKHYFNLIERARFRKLAGYTESHHVVPKCLGGTNDLSNLVKLTPEEHYVAHQLLVKMYPENVKLLHAAMMMIVSSDNHVRNNKLHGWLKRKYVSVCQTRVGARNPSYGKYWYYNPITLESIKCSIDSVPAGWIKGRIINKDQYSIRGICTVCGDSILDRKTAKFCNTHRPRHDSGAKNRFEERKDLFVKYIKEGYSFDISLKMVGYKNYNMKNGVGKNAQALLDLLGITRPLSPKRPPKTLA